MEFWVPFVWFLRKLKDWFLGFISFFRFCFLAGEVALPGGKTEEGDKDDRDTATREAKEEIGLDPSLVNVVTVLEPFLSKVSSFSFLIVRLLISLLLCGYYLL